MTTPVSPSRAREIGRNVPFLRRYARALTGSRESGDHYAAATLEAILADPSIYDGDCTDEIALFRAFHLIWTSTGTPVSPMPAEAEGGLARSAQAHLGNLTPNTREALLLNTIEEFSSEAVGQIMGIETEEAARLIDTAFQEMSRSTSGRILIIEDEPIIALDLQHIIEEMGHELTGIARTETGALRLADADPGFDLILSDIQLADGSSGADAVARLYKKHGYRPTIFITAFPERLLTGEGHEPTFLIAKPYTEEQVRSAVSQALFFAAAETLPA